MVDLPDGVVTFLFTDVEGSTRLWGGSTGHDDGAVRLHDEAIESALEKHNGISVKPRGEGGRRHYRVEKGAESTRAEQGLTLV